MIHQSVSGTGTAWMRYLIVLFITAGLLGGCALQREETLAAERRLEAIEQEKADTPEEPDLNWEAPADPAPKPVAEPERFDVSVRDLPARAFFLGLVDGTDVNLVVHPDVTGTVSLNLKQVTIEEVLKVARDVYGYEYERDGNIYTVYNNELRTEVFPIDYLDVQRVGVSDTHVSIGRANDSSGGRRNRNDRDLGQSGTANLLGLMENDQDAAGSDLTPGSRIQTLNQTDFWHSLEQTVEAIVGGEDESSVLVTPQAGMIVVKAMPRELNAVRDFLERSELSVKRQVILEAKILEVRLNEGFEAGVNWDAIGGQLAHEYDRGRINRFEDQIVTQRNGSASAAQQLITDTAIRSSEALFSSVLRVGDISKLLSLLETQGNVQVLSSPRVSTVNNQKALIRVGSDEYFITGLSSQTTANVASVTSAPNIELSSFFSGIALDVTPQISAEDEVILHIHPVVSEVSDQTKVFTIGDEEFSLPLARRGVRESDSIVRAASGQVVVLGGLMQETTRDQAGKRPLLGDIPLLNLLFKTSNQRREKTELVILLRPTVVGTDTWSESLEQAREQMQSTGDAYREMWND